MSRELELEKQTVPPLRPMPMSGLDPIRFGAEACQNLEVSSFKEWIITNGLGGYASSTITGMNTRRYHGLLVAAASPPVHRVVVLSKVEETIVTPSGRYELATNRYAGVVHPEGYRYLVEFRLDPWPTFFYRVGEILLEKSVFLLPGENAVIVGYTLHSAHGPIELGIRPLVALRDFRDLCHEDPRLNPRVEAPLRGTFLDKNLVEEAPGVLTFRPYEGLPALMIHHTAELVEHSPCWYKNFEYAQEEGGVVREDLWSPGHLLYLLKVGESSAFVASTGRRGSVDLTFHERRLENTQTVQAQTTVPPGEGPLTTRLSWTADSFIARPSLKETVLMAGFPWLSSWGRDALIALPGLTLATRRFDVARSILETLSRQIKGGLIPVRLSEEDGSAEYDSADTSLWFFWAAWHYWKATKDLKFIHKKLLDPLREIMEGYLEGTAFGIRMDEDGLIALTDEELPLTWMDAREPSHDSELTSGSASSRRSQNPQVPGRAVTPRFGKPVEVSALWYCALCIMAALAEGLGLKRAASYLKMSRLVGQHFVRAFVSPKGILYDRITPTTQDASIRPNMLIAASLPFTPVPKAQIAQVLYVTEQQLLTPMGIRTLTPQHPQYRGRYLGDLRARAHAYHQGSVWAWLLGPYVSTALKVKRLTPLMKSLLRKQMKPFLAHLGEGALGSVSELFDGDAPHTPRAGLSQAWSVGELLRAIQEAKLGDL